MNSYSNNPSPSYGRLSAGAPPQAVAPAPNYFVRHWHGELNPGWSVLAAFAASSFPVPYVTSYAIGFTLSTFAAMNGGRVSISTVALIALPFVLAFSVWGIVGAFRSAWRRRRSVAGIAVLIVAALLTLSTVGQMSGLIAAAVQPAPVHQVHRVH